MEFSSRHVRTTAIQGVSGVSSNEINRKFEIIEDNHGECIREDEILELSIKYVTARSKGNQHKYPEGWDKNMKRSVRKRADRVIMRGVEVMYKKKNSAEVRIIQSRPEQMLLFWFQGGPFGWGPNLA